MKVFARIAGKWNGKRLPGGYSLRLSGSSLRRHWFAYKKLRTIRVWPWRYKCNRPTLSVEVVRAFKRAAFMPGCVSFREAVRLFNLKRGSSIAYARLLRALAVSERAVLRRVFRARVELARLERKAAGVLR